MQIGTVLQRGIWQYLSKLHMHLSLDPFISLTEDMPQTIQRYLWTSLFIAGLFVIAKY